MNNARRFKNVVRTMTAFICISAAIAFSRPAMAAVQVQNGKLQQVEWNAGATVGDGGVGAPLLILKLASGGLFSAGLPAPGCGLPANSIDTLKTFLSTALAALAAGKAVAITYSTCNSIASISNLIVVSY